MADRPNHLMGYPMPPNNFMNIQQQQQQPQQSAMAYQQPQAPINPAQQIPGVTNPEDQRMWQQIQNRHRAMGGADGMGPQQINPQMAELLRSQAALGQAQNTHQQPQPQPQQSPPQLQQAQQFSSLGGISQMNANLPGQNSLLAMQRQQAISGGGMSGPIQNNHITPQMAQLLAAQRNGSTNPAMLQMRRQLGLLSRAEKQQPQNGPASFNQPTPSFNGAPNLGQLPFAANMFAQKQEEGRPSTTLGQQQFPPTGMQNGNGVVSGHGFSAEAMQNLLRTPDGRPLSVDDLRMRALQLRQSIQLDRKHLTESQKPSTPEGIMAFREKLREAQNKEILFNRLAEYIKTLMGQQGQQGGPSNLGEGGGQGGLNPMSLPNGNQQGGQQHIQSNQGWMPHLNNGSTPNQMAGNGLLSNQQMMNGAGQHGQGQASHQQITSPFPPNPNAAQSQQQTPVPPPTPHRQQMISGFQQNGGPPSAGSTQSNPGQQASKEGQEGQHRTNLPIVPRDRFLGMLQEWWKRNNIKPDGRMLMISNRRIDIHQLHAEVLQYGGVINVKRHGLWNVIAAKMGWIPAAIAEAGLTQDQVTEQFKTVYEQLLESFEMNYMHAAMTQSLTAPPQQVGQQSDQGQANAGLNQPTVANPQQITSQYAVQMMKLSNLTAEQLRASGQPEHVIQNIEQNRPTLQAAWRRVQLQRIQAPQQNLLQQQALQQQQQQGGLNPSLPFQNQLQAQVAAQRPSPLPPQGSMQGVNVGNNPGFSGPNQSTDAQVQQQHPPPIAPNMVPQNPQFPQVLQSLQSLQKPTAERVNSARVMIERLKQEITRDRNFRPEQIKHLTDAEKQAFQAPFDSLCTLVRDLATRYLEVYYACTDDASFVKGILNMYDMCDKQRQLMQGANPVYVLDLYVLQKLTRMALDSRSRIQTVLQHLRSLTQADQNQNRAPGQHQNDNGLSQPPAVHQGPAPHTTAPPQASAPPRPPTAQPLSAHLPQQTLQMPPSRTPQIPPARPPSTVRQRPVASSPNVVEPAPSPSVSTPVPTASTPSNLQASPQTPKSPKPKPQPKPRQRQRRVSKVAPPNQGATPATPTAVGSTPAGTSTPATTADVAPSPARTATSPVEKISLKRPREDEATAEPASSLPLASANDETPSKRLRNDWEPVSENEPSQRQVEVENIKTTGQAAQFYSDMSQLLELTNDSSLPPAIQETLTLLAKTVGPGIEIPDAGGSSLSNLTSNGDTSSKGAEGDDLFFNFLDFGAFQQDDDKGAADTPDLLPTSSTNPSPESGAGSEAEHPSAPVSSGSTGDRTKIVDSSESEPKLDFLGPNSDSLRLGIWGEVDGGESGYYNLADTFKFDGPTSSGDNPWAIST